MRRRQRARRLADRLDRFAGDGHAVDAESVDDLLDGLAPERRDAFDREAFGNHLVELPGDLVRRQRVEQRLIQLAEQTAQWSTRQEDALAEIKKSGKTTLHYLTDDQRKAWQDAMRPASSFRPRITSPLPASF